MCVQSRLVPTVIGAVILAVLCPATARGQDVRLANLLPQLVLNDIILERPSQAVIDFSNALGVPVVSHMAHFSPFEADELNNPAVGIVRSFNGQMATQFATFPLGSSTGGLTYVFDDSLGTFRRGSSSFGPVFGERALTIGRRRLSIGVNYQRSSYRTFEGQNLDDGSIKFYLRHQDCCRVGPSPNPPGFVLEVAPNGTRLNPPFESDLVEAALSLRATTHTTAVFANYGVTDRWDVGLAIPFVRVNLDARVDARVIRFLTATAPDVHTFEVGSPDAIRTVARSGHATGLGDVVLRSKYRLFRGAGGGLAAGLDLRLPTGDEEDLLGAGGVQAKLLLIVSSERGRLGQHLNVGYTFASGRTGGTFPGLVSTALPDEINYSGGIEFVAGPRITVVGDVIGRTLRNAGRHTMLSKDFFYPVLPPLGVGAGCESSDFDCTATRFDEFEPRPGHLNLLLGTAGFKVNPAGNWLISASVLFPLTDAGLRSRLTTVAGVDYAF